MANEAFVIIDKKDKDGEFLCEKIIKSPEFQEKKDYNQTFGINTYEILSDELKKRILSRDNPFNDKVYIDVSNLEIKIWIDRKNEVNNEFLNRFFCENPLYKDITSEESKKRIKRDREKEKNKDKENSNSQSSIKSSNKENRIFWWIGSGTLFIIFISLFVCLFRKRKKVKK